MLTVTQLARRCGLSRSTVLYYESIGLLQHSVRTQGNYRKYSEKDLARLRQICTFRRAGLKLEDIKAIVSRPDTDASSILERRLVEISGEIEQLRDHQRSIAALLRQKTLYARLQVITKDKWVSIMKSAGFSDADMHRWHAEFEKSAPKEHEEFLNFLHIPSEEIRQIREWSRSEKRS
jgi:DNA-binding transcriptional MerR regulator